MATYSRQLLSGSTNGKVIPVTGTATGSADTIHTAIVGTTGFDEIYIWASNTDTAAHTLTIEWGDTADPAGLICKALSIPANSPPIPVVTGEVLQNSLVVKAFADSASKINISGYVNRIS